MNKSVERKKLMLVDTELWFNRLDNDTWVIEKESFDRWMDNLNKGLYTVDEVKEIAEAVKSLTIQMPDTEKIERQLEYCSECIQMTNHSLHVCQKCKSLNK